jgi:hypothetical protein
MRIYGCGGLGLNIASKFNDLKGSKKDSVLLDSVEVSFIDTSESNLRHNQIDTENLYLIEGANGSGKNRAENYQVIKEQIKRVVLHHKPQEFNIIINSLSGGSGSVIGPLLYNELKDQGYNAINIVVGSSDSTIEISNTIKTLKSYIGISNKRKEPIIAHYFENSKESPRSKVDADIRIVVTLLALFLNRHNHELDSTDISNFLNYNKVTNHEPGFVFAKFYSKHIDVDNHYFPIAALTLAADGEDTSIGYPVDYQASGYVSNLDNTELMSRLPMHAVIMEGYVAEVIERLEKSLKSVDALRSATTAKRVKVEDSLDDGMVI